jgi:hypothetical protein
MNNLSTKHTKNTKVNQNPPLDFSHKVTQRGTKKKDDRKYPNEKFLEVQKPFFKKVFGRRRHNFMVNQRKSPVLTNFIDYNTIKNTVVKTIDK